MASHPDSTENPLNSEALITGWIAEITGKPEDEVRATLRAEFRKQGSTVGAAIRESGITPFTWSDDLARFYGQTDAFLYELVIWNMNRVKEWLRSNVTNVLQAHNTRPLEVLNIGDGLGFDSVHFARAGHRMTYFELPGYTETFARKVFEECDVDITVLTNEDDIPHEAFDAVICLDVLEHVPDPPAMVKTISRYLRPGGLFIVNAPFFMIDPGHLTHLKSNRRYSGSLKLYEQAGFKLFGGNLWWVPVVLQRIAGDMTRPNPWAPKRLGMHLVRCFLSLGRFPIVPYWIGNAFYPRTARWFGDTPAPVEPTLQACVANPE